MNILVLFVKVEPIGGARTRGTPKAYRSQTSLLGGAEGEASWLY